MDQRKKEAKSQIIIQEVNSKSDLRKFIHLHAAIQKDHPNWVPPIYKRFRIFGKELME